MSGRFRLRKVSERMHRVKPDEQITFPGELGLKLGGQTLVEVPNRSGFVYVRIRSDQSEVVQAYNAVVSPIYGLPVTIARDRIDKGRYYVLGRDVGRYNNWGSSAYLPFHGAMHSFNPDAPGADPVWVWSRQFTPILAVPSGSSAAMNVLVYPGTLYYDNRWIYAGMTGTADMSPYKPTGSNARMVLIYMDQAGNPKLSAGSYFAANLTGTQQIFPYLPSMPGDGLVPVAGVRLVSGSTTVTWDNLYDLRQFLHWGVFTGTAGSGAGGGHTIQYNGSNLTNRSYLNFAGPGFYVFDDAVNGATVVSGSAGGGGTLAGTLSREVAIGAGGGMLTGTNYFKLKSSPTVARINGIVNGVGDPYGYYLDHAFNFVKQDNGQPRPLAVWGYNSGSTAADFFSAPTDIAFYSAKRSETSPGPLVSGMVLGELNFRGYGDSDFYMGGMIDVRAIATATDNYLNAVMEFSVGNTGSLFYTQTYMNPRMELYQDRLLSYVPVAVSTGTNQGYYWGNIFTDGSWRAVIANDRVEFQKRISGQWIAQGYSNTGSSGGSAHIIQDEGVSLTARSKLNFVGAGLLAYDDAGNDATIVSGSFIPGHAVKKDGTLQTQRGSLNFVGTGFSVYDDGTNTVVSGTVSASTGTSLNYTLNDMVWHVDGALYTGTGIDTPFLVPRQGEISSVIAYVATPGITGSTVVDILKNGVSIFTTKPTVAFNDADQYDEVVPLTRSLAKGDVLSLSILGYATNASDLTVTILNSTTGSGGGGSSFPYSFQKWEPRIPPTSAHAMDDEFNDSSLAAKWVEMDTISNLTLVEDSMGLNMYAPTATGSVWTGVYQGLSGLAYPWSAYLGFTYFAGAGFAGGYVGLAIGQNMASITGTSVQALAIFENQGGLQIARYSDTGPIAPGTANDAMASPGFGATHAYLRIRAVSTGSFYFDISDDGISWHSLSRNINPGYAPAHLGILFARGGSNVEDARACLDFFRIKTHASFTGSVGGMITMGYST